MQDSDAAAFKQPSVSATGTPLKPSSASRPE